MHDTAGAIIITGTSFLLKQCNIITPTQNTNEKGVNVV